MVVIGTKDQPCRLATHMAKRFKFLFLLLHVLLILLLLLLLVLLLFHILADLTMQSI